MDPRPRARLVMRAALLATLLIVAPPAPTAEAAPPGCDGTLNGTEKGRDHCYFKITVRADTFPDGVPCAWVESHGAKSFYQQADKHGVIAFFEPGLMGRETRAQPDPRRGRGDTSADERLQVGVG